MEAHSLEKSADAIPASASLPGKSVKLEQPMPAELYDNALLSHLLSVSNTKYAVAVSSKLFNPATARTTRVALMLALATAISWMSPMLILYVVGYIIRFGPAKFSLDLTDALDFCLADEVQKATAYVQSDAFHSKMSLAKQHVKKYIPDYISSHVAPKWTSGFEDKLSKLIVYPMAIILALSEGSVHLPLKRKHEFPTAEKLVFSLDEPTEIRKRRRKSNRNNQAVDLSEDGNLGEGETSDLQSIVDELKVPIQEVKDQQPAEKESLDKSSDDKPRDDDKKGNYDNENKKVEVPSEDDDLAKASPEALSDEQQ